MSTIGSYFITTNGLIYYDFISKGKTDLSNVINSSRFTSMAGSHLSEFGNSLAISVDADGDGFSYGADMAVLIYDADGNKVHVSENITTGASNKMRSTIEGSDITTVGDKLVAVFEYGRSYFTIIDENGTSSQPQMFSDGSGSWEVSPIVHSLTENTFLVGWDDRVGNISPNGYFISVYDIDGKQVTQNVSLDDSWSGYTQNPQLLSLSDNKNLVVYQNAGINSSNSSLYMKMFDDTLQEEGARIEITTPDQAPETHPDLIKIDSNHVLVAWHAGRESASTPGGIFDGGVVEARIVNVSTGALSPVVSLGTGGIPVIIDTGSATLISFVRDGSLLAQEVKVEYNLGEIELVSGELHTIEEGVGDVFSAIATVLSDDFSGAAPTITSSPSKQIKSYVDGGLHAVVNLDAGYQDILQNDFDLIVGAQVGWTPRRWIGSIDEIRIWDVARSNTDISNYFDQSLIGTEAGLVYYLNFEGSTPFTDIASNLTAIENGSVLVGAGATIDEVATSGIFLDGNSYLQVKDAGVSPLDLSGSFTLEAWIKPSDLSAEFATVFQKSYSHPSENIAYGITKIGSQDSLALSAYPNNSSAWETNRRQTKIDFAEINDGEWHHIAFVVDTSGNATIWEDAEYHYTFTASDIDPGDTVTLSAEVKPNWLAFDAATGVLSGVPGDNAVGNHSIILRATDTEGSFVDQSFEISVMNVNDAPGGVLEVIGAATEDQILSAVTDTLADEDGMGELNFQWLRDGNEINGAIASSYKLTQDDVGSQISVSVSYTDGQGTDESVSSALTDIIQAAPVIDPAFDIVVASSSGNVATFEVYATEVADAGDPGLEDLLFVLSHNTADMTIDGASISAATGITAVPNLNQAAGTLTLGGFALPPFTDLSTPVLTFEATILNKETPLTIAIDDIVADNTDHSRIEEQFDFSSVSIESTIVGRGAQELSGVRVTYDFVTPSGQEQSIELPMQAAAKVSQAMARGSDVAVTADRNVDESSADAITANDALQALRLAVGLTKSDGTAEWHDYIAADINMDGQVTANDALNILKFAVGLTDGPSADWVFVDGDADWSGIGRRDTNYEEGVWLENVLADTSVNMTGILVGDVNGSYVA